MTNKTITEKYEKLEELRDKVKYNRQVMKYYNYLRELNKNDKLYGWLFSDDAILYDTLEDLSLYNEQCINHILNIYAGELESILTKSGVSYEE